MLLLLLLFLVSCLPLPRKQAYVRLTYGGIAMHRPQVYLNFLVGALLVIGLTVISASAQNTQAMQADRMQLSTREMQNVRAAVTKLTPTSFWAVTQDFEGNFENVDALMARFEQEARRQNIPNANPTGILVLYEDPTGKSTFRMAVGITLTQKVNVKEPLKVSRLAFSESARYRNVGPYQRLGPAFRGIETALRERPQVKGAAAAAAAPRNASWPVVLRLLSDPKKVPPEQRQTELIVPVRQ